MYPNLLLPLLTMVVGGAVAIGFLTFRQPVSRRLAVRQASRRKTEAVLVVSGSVLGTAIIIGALVVGDTLNHSVRQNAYRTLGPVDERVLATDMQTGAVAASRLAPLMNDPDVDGVLSARVDQAAASTFDSTKADPRVLAWDMDLVAAGRFGAAGGSSGLSGPTPGPGTIVVNEPFAHSLSARVGDSITVFLHGRPHVYRIARIVPQRGLAGVGLGAMSNHDIFLPRGTLVPELQDVQTPPRTVIFVSNRGGVESSDKYTSTVMSAIRSALGPVGANVTVESPKHALLETAKKTGDSLGALFLMIGSFSIIAGALLLVNIFVMLAEERKGQLGMLRAIGMKRSRLIGALTLEGTAYAVGSIVPGVLLGVGVGYGVALFAAQIFGSWSVDGSGLAISFAVTPTSIVNGVAMGLVIGVATILLTSIRISRINIIGAIRDLPTSNTEKARRSRLVVSTSLAILFALVSVPALAASSALPTLIAPSLALLCTVPLLRRRMSSRAASSLVASLVMAWSMAASVIRPRIFDTPSMAVYVVLGSLVAFSGVVLVSQNQQVLLWPVRRLMEGASQLGLAVRLAIAYPLTQRFRTGATLVMYTLITLVLVLLAEISGMLNKSIDTNVANTTAGFALRFDLNPVTSTETLAAMQSDRQADVTAIVPLTSALAKASDPGRRTTTPVRSLMVGAPAGALNTMTFDRRLKSLATDPAVWALVAKDPRYVVLDPNFAAAGGPQGRFFAPGDTFTVTNPFTGDESTKTIAGVLKSGLVFYAATGDGVNAFPIIGSDSAVRQMFGEVAQVSSALVKVRPGVDPEAVAPRLQGAYLSASLVVTPIAANVRKLFAANTAFFQLMQGFLALGLLVGVIGLGVVMVRAVRERRRTIGVLRALGFRSRTISQSFLIESGIVALEGIVLGAILGVVTTWLMYQKSAAFDGIRAGFPIVWGMIALMAGATFAASLLATAAPARRAARIKPAVAVRVAE